jgi:hypothetical protein
MIERQEKCLRRLASEMSEMKGSPTAQPKWVVNAESMIVIIQQVKQEPISQAQELIRKNASRTPHVVSQSPMENTLTSWTSFTQPASISRETNGRSDPSTCSINSLDSSDTPGLSSQTGAMVLRKKETGTRPVFHDYGDGNKETYEVGSFVLSSLDSDSDHRAPFASPYVPVPPFSSSDWKLRKKKNSGS